MSKTVYGINKSIFEFNDIKVRLIAMRKMNYLNFDEDIDIVPSNAVQNLSVEPNVNHSVTQYPLSAGSLMAGMPMNEFDSPVSILNLIDKSLNVISGISNCIATVSVEKQKTKQIEAQAHVLIEESKQATNRIKIQEKEHTKRLLIESRIDLEKTKFELEKLYEINRFREKELKKNHIEYMEMINYFERQIEDIKNIRNEFFKILIELNEYEKALEVLYKMNTQLLEINRQLIELRLSELKKE